MERKEVLVALVKTSEAMIISRANSATKRSHEVAREVPQLLVIEARIVTVTSLDLQLTCPPRTPNHHSSSP